MPDFYVDAVLGNNSNDGLSELLPKALLSQATFSANNRVFCKRGQTHPVSTYRFLATGMTLTAYGTGDRPVIQKSAGGDAWIYVQNASNVTLSHFCIDGAGYSGAGLALSAGSAHAISNVTISDVDVYASHGSAGLFISGVGTGTVRNVLVEDCALYANRNHGTLTATDVADVTYSRCTGHGNGLAIGAHNFSAFAASASPAPTRIKWEFCESHSCVDFDGIEGTGVQADDNTTNCEVIGMFCHDNQGAGVSFNSSSGHTMMGTLSVGNRKPGLYLSNSSTGCRAYNNTMTGNCKGGGFTAEITSNTNSTGFTSANNLLIKLGNATVGIGLSAGSASGSTSTKDCIFGYSTATQNITATNTVTNDPLLDANYRPTSASPCLAAGTRVSGVRLRDFYGKEIDDVPDIGAVQRYADRTQVVTRTPVVARTAASRTNADKRAS